MPQEKLILKGNCQEPGCTKRARHLRGYADIRVAWTDYVIKAYCGEHTRKHDERYGVFVQELPADNPRHLIPASSVLTANQRAARMAAEQEAYELALKHGEQPPERPEREALQRRNAAAPRVVQLS